MTDRINLSGRLTLSRRHLVRGAAIAVGSAPVLLASLAAAEAKITREAAAYRDTPRGDENCSNCSLFTAPAECTLVAGSINPNGWCRFHSRKS
jgi:hypothetical protein